jgi:hypothetical protein
MQNLQIITENQVILVKFFNKVSSFASRSARNLNLDYFAFKKFEELFYTNYTQQILVRGFLFQTC